MKNVRPYLEEMLECTLEIHVRRGGSQKWTSPGGVFLEV